MNSRMNTTAQPPVIIIGMHRSGTSLLTRVLQQAGFFMGRDASRNEEAAFTNAVNAWLFRQASATWDRPHSMDELLGDECLRPELVDYMEGMARGPASVRFLGPRGWLRAGGKGMFGQNTPWGWKDPRNTWTLPLWLELFPDARVLHIVRHGVDVAASLRARRETALQSNLKRYRRHRMAYRLNPFGPKRRGFGPQPLVRRLDAGVELWAEYVDRSREHLRALGPEQALELRYEDLLIRPREELKRGLEFSGCTADPGLLESTAAGFRSNRAYAWTRDEELRALAASHHDILSQHGYSGHP